MNPPSSAKQPGTQRSSLSSVAILLMATSLGVQLLGLLRTRLVNANFDRLGAHSTDAYFAAFNIPDFFFFTLAAGALGVAFMPVISDHLHRGDRKGLWEISSSLLNLLTLIMAAVGIVIFVFAQPIVHYVLAPAMSAAQTHETVIIMRLIAFNPLLFTISGVLTSLQQTFSRFFFYAVAPIFYNVSIIVSALLFSDTTQHGGPWHLGIAGLGLGALIGAVLQLTIVCIGMLPIHFRWRPYILWHRQAFRVILQKLPPRSLDQGIDQLESIVETHFARQLGQGFVTDYNNAYIIGTAPILLVGTAISTAAFPRLTARLSQGRPDLFRQDFQKILRVMIWLVLPITIVTFFARAYLARLIFSNVAPDMTVILGYLAGFIFFGTLYTLISRWFYAQKDTRTPLIVSVFAIACNIFLVYLLARPDSYDIAGLALAQSIVATGQVMMLAAIMVVRDRKLFDLDFIGSIVRIISVSGFSMIAGYITVSLIPLGLYDRGFITIGGKLVIIAGVVFATHLAISWLFGLDELYPLFERIKRIVSKPAKIDIY